MAKDYGVSPHYLVASDEAGHRARVAQSRTSEPVEAPATSDGVRTFPEWSATTAAMLLLLVRWSATLKEVSAASARALFVGMVGLTLPQCALHWYIELKDAAWPTMPSQTAVRVDIQDGRADITMLLRRHSQFNKAARKLLRQPKIKGGKLTKS